MVTKTSILVTLVITMAVAALVFAYSTPTQGAGAAHSQKSGGANQTKQDPPTGPGTILDPSPPPTGSINDAKLKKIDAGTAISGNQGVAEKFDTGKVIPQGGKFGPTPRSSELKDFKLGAAAESKPTLQNVLDKLKKAKAENPGDVKHDESEAGTIDNTIEHNKDGTTTVITVYTSPDGTIEGDVNTYDSDGKLTSSSHVP